MKEKIIVIFLIFSAFGLNAQNNISVDEVISFLLKYTSTNINFDSGNQGNILHNSEVISLFSETLINRNTYSQEQRNDLRKRAFEGLRENTRSAEDSAHLRRLTWRRMIMNMTLALLSAGNGEYSHFLSVALSDIQSVYAITDFPIGFNRLKVLIKLVEIIILLERNSPHVGVEINSLVEFIIENDFVNEFGNVSLIEFQNEFLNDLFVIFSIN